MTLRGVGNAGPRGGPRGDIHVAVRGRGRSALRARRRGSLHRGARHLPAARARRRRSACRHHDARCRCACRRGRRAGRCSICADAGLPRVNASGIGRSARARAALDARVAVTDEQEALVTRTARIGGSAAGDARARLLGEDEGCAWRLSTSRLPRCRSAGCRCASMHRMAHRASVWSQMLDGWRRRAVQEVGSALLTHLQRRAERSMRLCARARQRRARRVRAHGARRGRLDTSMGDARRRAALGRIAVAPPWLSDDIADAEIPIRHRAGDGVRHGRARDDARRARAACSHLVAPAIASPISARAAPCSRSRRRSSAPRASPRSRSIPTRSGTRGERRAQRRRRSR